RICSRRVRADGLAQADVEMLAPEADAPIDPQSDLCARVLRRIVEAATPGLIGAPPRYDSAAWVSARLAELLPLSLASKQRLLEMDAAPDRLEILRRLISSTGQ
ncbi:MAG TPA: hypothetical protein VLE94_05375, partial [Burkholderiaceae bacterium]|nr:hypothetical protein [Burkholderiaceae bacterium]